MKRIVWFVAPAIILALAAPVVLAGEGKCNAGTQECLNKMVQAFKQKGWIGVEINNEGGLMQVTKIMEGSPAEKAGLAPGDVLFAVNGIEYAEANTEKFSALRDEMTPGKEFTFTILKQGQDKTEIPITLAAMPEEVMAQWIGKHMIEHVEMAQAEE